MSKAILVLDEMPNSCHDCRFLCNHYTQMSCKAVNGKTINLPYPKDFRQSWCPLKELAEQINYDEHSIDYIVMD